MRSDSFPAAFEFNMIGTGLKAERESAGSQPDGTYPKK